MRPYQLQQPLRGGVEVSGVGVDAFADFAGNALAELYAPLVKRVDVPDYPLYEHLVLIERNQRTQVFWR